MTEFFERYNLAHFFLLSSVPIRCGVCCGYEGYEGWLIRLFGIVLRIFDSCSFSLFPEFGRGTSVGMLQPCLYF